MSKLSDYSKFDHLDSDSDDEEGKPQQQQQQQTNSSSTTAAGDATTAQVNSTTSNNSTNISAAADAGAVGIFTRDTEHANRFVFEYPKGNPIYSWEQTLDSVTLLIPTPHNIVTRASQLDCRIHPNRLQVGLRIPSSDGNNNNNNNRIDDNDNGFFLDEPTAGTVDIHNSTWTWENNVLTMELFKANKGVVWRAVTLGCTNTNTSKNNSSITNTNTTAAQLDPFQLEQEQKRLLLERWQEENPGMDFRDAEFNGSVPDPRTFMGGVRYD
jgi:CS domain